MSITESLLGTLVKQLGIDPVQLTAILNSLVSEMNAIHADRLAFKTSAVAVVSEFRTTLARIENRLEALEHTASTPVCPETKGPDPYPPLHMNGSDHV
jgi:hypothetical protein